jgi:hypothetical protein
VPAIYDSALVETVCVKVRLKPDSIGRVRAWAAELTNRADETLATLRDEGVIVESAFLDRTAEGDFLIYYLKAKSLNAAAEAVSQSLHPIDAYHQQFKREAWDTREQLELLIDFENLPEGTG